VLITKFEPVSSSTTFKYLSPLLELRAKLPYTSPPQKLMYWNQSIDLIHPNENKSTLSGVGLCKVRLELFDNKNNTQFKQV
jgi:hypothetical protein